MKKLSFLIALFVAITSCKGSEPNHDQQQIKRYKIESGIVEYKTTIDGNVMGSQITGSGVEHLYFKNWGAIELREGNTSQTSVIKFFGKEKKETTATHSMNKIEDTKNYMVNFDKELITVSGIPGMMLVGEDKDAEQTGKDMMIAMGGEQIGTEEFMGYNCEIWTLLGAKQWLYKGVMLKMEMNTLGITTVTEAVSAEFDISVPQDKFQLPNYTIEEADEFTSINMGEYEDEMEEMDASMDMISNMSYEEWKKAAVTNDEEMNQMSEEELQDTYNMLQRMIKMRSGN